ncbi:Na+/Ca+ antiporter, CaCA family [Methanosalsum zhilinae DSM 4017]|uniref:Na+/Ca+ antiporter, CaCA family n=1 Tax=Methanosalsum zhilinae (strain DSM 4017 / NBRC 107636 / OCM 62 / WeN5) TaxID=679901 RepID=F7XPE8_METZD|nr:calcium/sodium antiporter [Methanosalsum zhilinae]AEH60276.1 Na+/Ca+ antiporter, CaCA family [Methanosalsum zhilinae DSM 4017]
MAMLMVLLFILSIIIISKGADWFIDSSVSVSVKCGIPKVIIGATIVSFATVAPEFLVSIIAAFMGHTELAVGNAVGSVICNIGLVLGFVVAVRTIPISDNHILKKCIFMLVSALALIILTLNGTLTAINGLFLLLIFAGFIYYNYRLQNSIWNMDNSRSRKEMMSDIKGDILYFITGALAVIIGSRLLVYSGVELAHAIGIPELIIGLTLVSFGTSVPELITAISALIKKHQDLSVGNIIGANTMDIALILGVAPFVREIPILPQSISYDFPVMLLIMIVLIIPAFIQKKLNRWLGFVLLGLYAFYIAGLFIWYM